VPRLGPHEWPAGDLASVPLTPDSLAAADCVVILTNHTAFDYDAIVRHAPLVVDTRNAIKQRAPHVFKLGAPGN
jgi:UDP-N-acetyl-D-glucosamine dehydrogenase